LLLELLELLQLLELLFCHLSFASRLGYRLLAIGYWLLAIGYFAKRAIGYLRSGALTFHLARHLPPRLKSPMRHLVLALLALSLLKASAFDPATLSIEQLKNGIENQHPAYFYYLAKKLFVAGQKDDAVFWFYAGQLRYRVYLAVNKDKLDPSGDPAVFSALSEEVGRPINEYAFGDIPQLAKTIDAVIAWDQSHDNALTPRAQHKSQYDQIVSGLTEMRDQVLQQADSIRKTRTANGLPNRN
jgi:hypothetical protein